MSPSHSFLILSLVSCAARAVFHHPGSVNGSAPYSNSTLRTTSSPTISTESINSYSTESSSTLLLSEGSSGIGPSKGHGFTRPTNAVPSGTTVLSAFSNATTSATQASLNVSSPVATLGTAPFPVNDTATLTTRISNATCTINIPHASVDYWHPATYSFAIGTMTTSAANFSNPDSYTLVPATTSFDAASALASDWACTASTSYISEWDFTITDCVEYTEKPNAAATSLAYRTGYSSFPYDGVISKWDARLYDVYYDLPPATATLSLVPNVTRTETSATPFVYFTAYEIESGNQTETVQLPSAQAYPYWLKGVEHEATATGSLPEGFLENIPQSACDAGRLQATVTVLIVVDLFYINNPYNSPFLIHFESSVLGFEESPVFVNNMATSEGQPVTVADWDLSSTTAKSTAASKASNPGRVGPFPTAKASNDAPKPTSASKVINPARIRPVPTTRASNDNHDNNNAEKSALRMPNINPSHRVTVGTVGTDPVVIGPWSEVVVGAITLQPGGPPIVVGGGTPVSLAPSASAIVIGGTTSRIPQLFVSPNQPQSQPRPPPVLTVGSSTLTPNAATQFFVDPGQTLTPGGVATVDGTIISLAPSAGFVVIGGATQVLAIGPGSIEATRAPPRIVVGDSIITAQPTENRLSNPDIENNPNPGPTFVIAGQTLDPGGPALTVSGTTLSLAPSGSFVVVNGVPSAVLMPAPISFPPTLTVSNAVFSPLPGSGNTFVIAEQTLAPGGSAITVAGNTLSLAPFASFVVVNGATSTLARPAFPFNTQPTIILGNEVFSPVPGSVGRSFIIGGQTLAPGGSAMTFSGTTLSLAPSASFVVINGVTSTLANIAIPAAAQVTAPPLTIGDMEFKPLPGTETAYLIGSLLLTPGGSIVTAGTTISLASGATALVINGQTSLISPPQAQPIITNPPLLTIDSQTYTAVPGGGTTFVIGGQTLTPGGAITVDGTTINLAPLATELVYGSEGRSTTTALFPATNTKSQSVTSTPHPSAGASSSDGQAVATESSESSASGFNSRVWIMSFVPVALSCFMV